MQTKVSFTVSTVTREDTGEVFVIQDEKDLAEFKKIELADVEQRLAVDVRTGASESVIKKRREMLIAEIETRYERVLADRLTALPLARQEVFDLKRVTFGEKNIAYAAARSTNYDTVEATIDPSAYQNQLLLAALGGDQKRMDDLDPVIAAELGRRVFRMVHPDQKRLPFAVG